MYVCIYVVKVKNSIKKKRIPTILVNSIAQHHFIYIDEFEIHIMKQYTYKITAKKFRSNTNRYRDKG